MARGRLRVGLATFVFLAAGLVVLGAVATESSLRAPFVAPAQQLADRFEQAGLDTADRITPPLEVLGVVGHLDPNGDRASLDALNVTVRVANGVPVDLSTMLLRLRDGDVDRWLELRANASVVGFDVRVLRDLDRSLSASPPVLDGTDLVSLGVDVRHDGGADVPLPVRTSFRLELLPERGAAVHVDLTTPIAYATGSLYTLK